MNPLEIHASLVARQAPGLKRCSRCAVLKPVTAFYHQGAARSWKPRADCKVCFKKSRIARRAGLGEVTGSPGND